jgi:hypothetical protein
MSWVRWPALALAVVGVGIIVGLGPPAPAQPASSSDAVQLLHAATTAATHLSYSGELTVEWSDRGQLHQAQTSADVVDGVVEVGDGGELAVSSGAQRWVGSTGNWALVLGPDVAAATPPHPDANWSLQTQRGPVIAGEPTTDVVVSDPHTGAARARYFIDRANGALLRREVLDRNGHLVREVSFDQLVALGTAPPPAPRPRHARRAEPTRLGSMPGGYDAPSTLGRGYRLLGRYRQPDGTVQVFYGDGLFTLSLFEQRGTLDWASVPNGSTQQVDGVTARLVATPTTSAVVWDARGVVTTCVSDAPPDQVMLAVDSLVHHDSSSSVGHDIAHFVLGPFGWN